MTFFQRKSWAEKSSNICYKKHIAIEIYRVVASMSAWQSISTVGLSFLCIKASLTVFLYIFSSLKLTYTKNKQYKRVFGRISHLERNDLNVLNIHNKYRIFTHSLSEHIYLLSIDTWYKMHSDGNVFKFPQYFFGQKS